MRIGALVLAAALGGMTAGVALSVPAQASDAKKDAEKEQKLAAERQALVGHWKLNPELSEDAREKMREAGSWRHAGGMGGGGGMGRPGGWGGGGGGMGGGGGWGRRGGHGGEQGDPSTAADDNRMRRVGIVAANEISVTGIEPDVVVALSEDVKRTLHPDGKKYDAANGGEEKTQWKDARLVVETKSERGEVKETWSVSPQTKQLTINLEIHRASGPSVSVKRVFDPVTAENPAAAPAADSPKP